MYYKRISRNFWNYALFPLNTDIQAVIEKYGKSEDYYESIYNYKESHYKAFIKGLKEACTDVNVEFNEDRVLDVVKEVYFKASKLSDIEKEAVKAKFSVSGTEDVTTNNIVFDFDNKENPEKAKDDTLSLLARLSSLGINRDEIQVCFSGNKGFSVVVETAHEFSRPEFENIVSELAKDLSTFDTSISDEQRLFRIPLTKHNSSGLYKIPLTDSQLAEQSMDDIKAMAKPSKVVSNIDLLYDIQDSWTVCNKLPEYILTLKEKKVEEKTKEKDDSIVYDDRLELSKKPAWLSSTKFALQEGFFPKGDGTNEGVRNTAFMILAATYRANGFPKEITWRMLKGVAELQAKRNDCDEYSEERLWKEIVSHVYSNKWKGGTYSEKETELLRDTADRFNLKTEENTRSLSSIEESILRFKKFAAEFSKSRILFGLDSLDEKVVFTAGMMVGLLAAPGAGKCLGKGTLVRMYDGSLKKVEDIVPGDVLMGDDSTPRNVLSTCTGVENLYKIKQENGNDYIVNESHILSLKNNVNFKNKVSNKRFEKKIIDIELRDYLKESGRFKKYYKGYKVGVEYSEKEVHLDPYVLGIWLGDGTSAQPQFTNPDPQILAYLRKELCENKGLICRKYSDDITFNFVSKEGKGAAEGSNYLLNNLKGYEVLNNKHIPKSYKYNRKDIRMKLLAGIIDSDGSYDSRKNSYDIMFKSTKLALDVQDLCRSLGFRVSLNKKMAKYKSFTRGKLYEGESEVNRLYISGEFLHEIPVLLERKKAIKKDQTTDNTLTKIEVELLGEGDYYGFQIDGNKRFLLEDYTVTHNTTFLNQFMKNTSKNGERVLYECLDMTENFQISRMIQNYVSYDFEKILKMIERNEIDENLAKAFDQVAEDYANLSINYRSGTTVDDIENDIKTHYSIYGEYPRLVAIDYLEKIRGPYTDATALSGYVASRLSDIAREYNVCLFVLLQPQKSAGDARNPLLSMRRVKGASVIEQDCRAIMTMWRPGFNPEDVGNDKYASIAIVKNNMGGICKLDYMWDGLSGQVRDMNPAEKDMFDDFIKSLEEEEDKKFADAWRPPSERNRS